MGFDQARQHEHAAAVDDSGAGRLKIFWLTGDNGAIAYMHVAIGDIAGLVHRYHIGVADDEGAAGRQSASIA